MNIDVLARDNVKKLVPYQSAGRIGGQGEVWLNANEYPSSTFYQLSDQRQLNRYPECQPQELLCTYAKYVNVHPNQVLVCRGADEGIELLIRTFCEPGKDGILYCPPTYGMYGSSAEVFGITGYTVPLKNNWRLDLDGIKPTLSNIKLIYICNPNNPTGHLIDPKDIHQLLQLSDEKSLVIVDEAYIEFIPEKTIVSWLKMYPHLVILRTLSKAFALAGIRCGFVIAHEKIITLLLKVITPYPLAIPTIDIAIQALSSTGLEAMRKNVFTITKNRTWLFNELTKCKNITKIYPSNGNYLLFRCNDSQLIFNVLSSQGVILRDQSKQLGLNNCLRITVGTPEENVKAILALKALPVILDRNL